MPIKNEEAAAAYHHGDLRNALIQAGLALLTEEGVQTLSLRAVARRVGVSHAAPYRHFADKDALLAAIAEEGFGALATAVRTAIARVPTDPTAQLAEAGWAYVQFALHHPAHLRVMFGGVLGMPGAQPPSSAAWATAFTLLVGIIQGGQRVGAIVEGDPEHLALVAWSLVHGLAVLLIAQQGLPGTGPVDNPEQLTRRCSAVLDAGLQRRPH